MKIRKLVSVMVVMLMLAGCLGGCSKSDSGNQSVGDTQTASSADSSSSQSVQPQDASKNETTPMPTESTVPETSSDVSADSSVNSTTEGGLTVTTEVSGGYTLANGVLTITAEGEYKVSGSASEGRIIVNAPEQKVTIILSGAQISSSIDSVISVEKADEVTVKALNGTVNTLNDNRARKEKNSEDETGNACVYSKDDLSIQGKGTLIINAGYSKGIYSKNDIKIKNLTLTVTAPGTAIQGNDSITIESGVITVTSTEGDGLKTKETDISLKGKQRGNIVIASGTVSVTAADECFKAARELQITEGPDTVVTQAKY